MLASHGNKHDVYPHWDGVANFFILLNTHLIFMASTPSPQSRRSSLSAPVDKSLAFSQVPIRFKPVNRTEAEGSDHKRVKSALAGGCETHPRVVETITEKQVGDKWADVFLVRRALRPVVIEVHVHNSTPQFRSKTRCFLKQGYDVCWVFYNRSKKSKNLAEQILGEEMRDVPNLGSANIDDGMLNLGQVVTFDNYGYSVAVDDITAELCTNTINNGSYGVFSIQGTVGEIRDSTRSSDKFVYEFVKENGDSETYTLNQLKMVARSGELKRVAPVTSRL